MNTLVSLLPTLVRRIPPGIQALIFVDQYIEWENSCTLLPNDNFILNCIEKISFLKLSFVKYAFGLSAKEALANAGDRISLSDYVGHSLPPHALMSQVQEPLENFVSPYGGLGELIFQIDRNLKKHGLHIERRPGGGDFRLVPVVVYESEMKEYNFINQGMAVWL